MNSLVALGLIILVAGSLSYYLLQSPSYAASSLPIGGDGKITLEIPPGTGLDEIGFKLERAKLIRSRLIFEIYALLAGKARLIKPGKYNFEPGLGIPRLVKILVDGPPANQVVIIPGMTVAEIDDKLSSLGITARGDILGFDVYSLASRYPWLTKFANSSILSRNKANSLEGLLFPDTYYFSYFSDKREVVQKILDNFEVKALPFFGGENNLLKVLTLASLLEKETPDYGDQQIVSGILEKRLAAKMPLQVDATIVYIKCGGRFQGCGSLTQSDYKIDSPYNTYLYADLTPTPIDNPGLPAIRAALNPKLSAYWYYLSDPRTKKTIFSKTLDDQNKNKVRYLLN